MVTFAGVCFINPGFFLKRVPPIASQLKIKWPKKSKKWWSKNLNHWKSIPSEPKILMNSLKKIRNGRRWELKTRRNRKWSHGSSTLLWLAFLVLIIMLLLLSFSIPTLVSLSLVPSVSCLSLISPYFVHFCFPYLSATVQGFCYGEARFFCMCVLLRGGGWWVWWGYESWWVKRRNKKI